MTFIELTSLDDDPILLCVEQIVAVWKTTTGCCLGTLDNRSRAVKETYEEVKKRLGLRITPRGETIGNLGELPPRDPRILGRL